MLCETPRPRAPRNELPAAWNGVTGKGVAGCPIQRAIATPASTPKGSSTVATNQPDAVPTTTVPRRLSQVAATPASTPKGSSTVATNQPDAVPTTTVPRRLSQVAPQINANATSQASSCDSPGAKNRRY